MPEAEIISICSCQSRAVTSLRPFLLCHKSYFELSGAVETFECRNRGYYKVPRKQEQEQQKKILSKRLPQEFQAFSLGRNFVCTSISTRVVCTDNGRSWRLLLLLLLRCKSMLHLMATIADTIRCYYIRTKWWHGVEEMCRGIILTFLKLKILEDKKR